MLMNIKVRMSGPVSVSQRKKHHPSVAIGIVAEQVPKQLRMLNGVDVVNDIMTVDGLMKSGSAVVATELFDELEPYLLDTWNTLRQAPGNLVTVFDDAVVRATIDSVKQEVYIGDMPVREAFSATAALMRYYIKPDMNSKR